MLVPVRFPRMPLHRCEHVRDVGGCVASGRSDSRVVAVCGREGAGVCGEAGAENVGVC